MSTDNVTPIRTLGDQPPKPPRKPRPRRQKAEISFGGNGEGSGTLIIWQGLRGVCRELRELGGNACIDSDTVERFSCLGAAACVLSELMEDRLIL